MSMQRWMSLGLVIAMALPWSVSLGVLGLWILLGEHTMGMLSKPMVSGSAGICALAAGQLVFLMCIADRVFLRVPAALARSVELGLGAILFVGTVVLSVAAIGGGMG